MPSPSGSSSLLCLLLPRMPGPLPFSPLSLEHEEMLRPGQMASLECVLIHHGGCRRTLALVSPQMQVPTRQQQKQEQTGLSVLSLLPGFLPSALGQHTQRSQWYLAVVMARLAFGLGPLSRRMRWPALLEHRCGEGLRQEAGGPDSPVSHFGTLRCLPWGACQAGPAITPTPVPGIPQTRVCPHLSQSSCPHRARAAAAPATVECRAPLSYSYLIPPLYLPFSQAGAFRSWPVPSTTYSGDAQSSGDGPVPCPYLSQKCCPGGG